jgi:ABC-type transport system involved in cytochrome c biogenesis permease subunit
MNLITLENVLDNLSFAVLFVTMLIYWGGAAFPQVPLLAGLGTTGMAIANLVIAGLLASRWMEAGYFPISNLYESLFFLCWGITAIHLVDQPQSSGRGRYLTNRDGNYCLCRPDITSRDASLCAAGASPQV